MNDYEAVLSFWFGELDAQGRADPEQVKRWWKKDPAFDETIRQRFGALHEALMRRQYGEWLESARGRLAAVIVLDQFSRNMFRGTAAMFASDSRALEFAEAGIAQRDDRRLALAERGFLYMPLEHSEDLARQERCVALFHAWRDGLPQALRSNVESMVHFAERHHEIIRRFGRFPHRNAILGRSSSPQELEFLNQPGSSF